MKNILLFISFFLALAAPAGAQTRLYVRAGAAGQNTGASWADAFTDLQSALQAAQSGDEVWVAEGTYVPGPGRDSSFRPVSGLRLYGGFAGTESTLAERGDWAAHPAVLSGDIGAPADSTDNSYNIMYLYRPDSATLIDGFVFADALADAPAGAGNAAPGRSGAALYIDADGAEAYPTIRNCRFERNTALYHGGAVYVNGAGDASAAPVFEHCVFERNRARKGEGGALYRMGGSWVDRPADIDACTFRYNRARFRGGAIFFEDTERSDTFDVQGVLFEKNNIDTVDLIYPEGGSVLCLWNPRVQGASVLNIRNSSLLYNEPGTPLLVNFTFGFQVRSVAVFLDSVYFEGNAGVLSSETLGWLYLKITNCIFNNTDVVIATSSDIPAFEPYIFFNILITNCTQKSILKFSSIHKAIIQNLKYDNNDSYLDIFITGEPAIASELIINNISSSGNALSTIHRFGSGLNGWAQRIGNINCTNISGSNIGIFMESDSNFLNNSVFHTSLIQISEIIQLYVESNFIHLDHNLLNIPEPAGLPAAWLLTDNIWATDPMFVNPDSGDLRPQPCSPLINAGSNAWVQSAVDIAGAPRTRGAAVDIGAYEHQGPRPAAEPQAEAACPGVANGAVTAELTDFCPPLAFAWTDAAGNAGAQIQQLPAGYYSVTATDQNGLDFVFDIEVPLADTPQLQPYALPVLCGDTLGGTASAGMAGGQPPYQLLWSDGSTDTLRTQLPPGIYPVTVTDARGCSASGDVEVTAEGHLSLLIEAVPVSCYGAADGAFTVLPADGLAPYAWLWSDGASGPTQAPIGPGLYYGTLTDAFGCDAQWILPMPEPEPLALEAEVTHATGPATPDGGIVVQTITGGTQPWQLMWSNGQSGLLCGPVPPGTYTVTLTDEHGCTLQQSYIVGATPTREAQTGALRLWPNPAHTAVYLAVPGGAAVEGWRLYDAQGALVRAGAGGQAGVEGLPAGMYLLRASAAGKTYVGRVRVE